MKGQQTTTIDKFYIHQYTSLGIKHALHTFLKAIQFFIRNNFVLITTLYTLYSHLHYKNKIGR